MVLVLWQLVVRVGTSSWLYPDRSGRVDGFGDLFNHRVYHQFTLLHRSRIGQGEEGGDSDDVD